MTGEERMEPGNQVNFGSWMRKGYRSVTAGGTNRGREGEKKMNFQRSSVETSHKILKDLQESP